MKRSSKPNLAKYFKYKFSKLIFILALAVIAVCIVGIILSILRIIENGIDGVIGALTSPFYILICVFCIILVISILIKSQYIIDEKHLITQFGFIKSKFIIKEVTSILLNTDTNKLTVNMGEQFFVLSIDPKWNEDFVQALREINPNIDYSFTLASNDQNTQE